MSEPIDVGALADLEPGTPRLVETERYPICVVRLEGGGVCAIHDICSHQMASLSGGWVDNDRIECPRHGARFSLRTGEALSPPASKPVPTFPVTISDGRVLVDPTPSHPHPLVN